MLKRLLFIATLGLGFTSNSQIVINEIMFNPPESGTDSLEYIELYNAGVSPVDMTGYTLTGGTFTFPSFVLAAGDYALIVVDSMAFVNIGIGDSVDFQWTSSGLSNSGEALVLKDALGGLVDSVFYRNTAPWNTLANGGGPSLELCSPASDNNDGSNWDRAYTFIAMNAASGSIYGTPGAANNCTTPPSMSYFLRTIDEVNNSDPVSGIADSLGLRVELRGIVNCVDFDGDNGYDFPLANSNGEGIRVFSSTDVNSYNVGSADSLHVFGTIIQFNGLTQVQVDSVSLVAAGAPLVSSTVVSVLGEVTENKHVELQGVHLVDPAEWTNTGSGFNVRVTNGSSDTNDVRIDADVDIYGTPAPTGIFDVKGWGGQFDNTNPYTSGYQLLPCSLADINLVTTGIESISKEVLTIYPNPTNNILNINGVKNIEVVEVYNTVGKIVYSYKESSINAISVSGLNAGNYIIVVKSPQNVFNKQFTVIK